jgi:hypothetical protein
MKAKGLIKMKSRVLIIPDIHLKPQLFDRAEKILLSGQADFAIQLGDLVDDWKKEYDFVLYANTMSRAIGFHKKFPSTLWCMGNHDFGYYDVSYGRKESGHSRAQEDIMRDSLYEFAKAGIVQEVIHIVGNVIFSHAGLTHDWVQRQFNLLGVSREPNNSGLLRIVNYASRDELWSENSPLWARPQFTHETLYGNKLQVVGHTPLPHVKLDNNLLSTDVFSTFPSGASIGEERFVIVDTQDGSWEYADEN